MKIQKLGLYVPTYFVLNNSYFEAYLKRAGASMPDAERTLLLEKIQNLGGFENKLWVVRPSSNLKTHRDDSTQRLFSTARDLKSLDEIVFAIEKLWHDACSKSFLEFCRRWSINPKSLQMAVIIQEQVTPEVSGYLHTANPDNGHDKEMVMEAWVGGCPQNDRDAHPASFYHIPWFGAVTLASAEEKHNLCWRTEDLDALRTVGHKIQAQLGRPQTIDFAKRGDRFFILSSRPLSSLRFPGPSPSWKPLFATPKTSPQNGISPLSWSLQSAVCAKALPEYLLSLGCFDRERERETPWYQITYGEPRWNYGALKEALGEAFNPSDSHTATMEFSRSAELGAGEARAKNSMTFRPLRRLFLQWKRWRAQRQHTIKVTALLRNFANIEAKLTQTRMHELGARQFEILLHELFDAYIEYGSAHFIATLHLDSEKVSLQSAFKPFTNSRPHLAISQLLSDLGPTNALEPLKELKEMALILHNQECRNGVNALLSKLGPILMDELDALPDPLSRTLKNFIDKFYYQSANDLDLRIPRWSEDARLLLIALRSIYQTQNLSTKTTPLEINNLNLSFDQTVHTLRAIARKYWWRIMPWEPHFALQKLSQVRRQLCAREQIHSCCLRLLYFIRQASLEIARRHYWLVDPTTKSESMVFYSSYIDQLELTWGQLSEREFLLRAQQNWHYAHGYESFSPFEDQSPSRGVFAENESASGDSTEATLQGIGASLGRIKGRARIVDDPQSASDWKAGDILVTRQDQSALTPLVAQASGVICENGDLLSTTALVTREFGIPTVVNVAGATKKIKNGQEIEIDGGGGEVYLQ